MLNNRQHLRPFCRICGMNALMMLRAGTRTILQAGANMLNNNAPSLAPAPGMAPTVNVTTRSFFVLTAATGSLTRTKSNDPTFTNGAVLTLDYIDQQVTWYSGRQQCPVPSCNPAVVGQRVGQSVACNDMCKTVRPSVCWNI